MTMAAGAVVSIAIAIAAPGALAAAPRARVGTVTPQPLFTGVVGDAPAARHLRITVQLRSRDPLALARFATAVSTPRSPHYGDLLSVAQFARRFG